MTTISNDFLAASIFRHESECKICRMYLAFYIYDAFYDVIHGNVPKEMVHYQSNYPIIE